MDKPVPKKNLRTEVALCVLRANVARGELRSGVTYEVDLMAKDLLNCGVPLVHDLVGTPDEKKVRLRGDYLQVLGGFVVS